MKRFYFCGILLGMLMCGCSETSLLEEEPETMVNLTVVQIEDEDASTRLASSVNASSAFPTLKYESGDEFGIFPNTAKTNGDSQIRFLVKTGGTSVSISAGAWKTNPANTYVSYVPYSLYNTDPEAIPVSYVGQVQSANNNAAHLAKSMLIASTPVTSDGSSFNFLNAAIGCVLKFNITVPKTATYTKMEFVSSKTNHFVQSGTVNLFGTNQPLTAKKSSNTMELGLNNISVSEGNTLTAYMLLAAPVDLGAIGTNTFTVKLYCNDSSGKSYICSLSSQLNSMTTRLRNRNKGGSLNIPNSTSETWTTTTDNSLGTLTGVIE